MINLWTQKIIVKSNFTKFKGILADIKIRPVIRISYSYQVISKIFHQHTTIVSLILHVGLTAQQMNPGLHKAKHFSRLLSTTCTYTYPKTYLHSVIL